MTALLTDKQERFVLEYLQDHNATAAARRAGYADSTRGSHATALMKMPAIRQRIQEETAELFSRLRLTAFNIMQAQSRAAFFDPRKLFDDQGQPLPINALDAETAGALTVHYDQRPRGNTLRVRQAPRHTALAALERRYGRFLALEMSLVESRLENAAQDLVQEAQEEPQAAHDAGTASAVPASAAAPASSHAGTASPHAEPEFTLATGTAPIPVQDARDAPQKPGGAWRHSELLNSLFGTPMKPAIPASPSRNPQNSATGVRPVLTR